MDLDEVLGVGAIALIFCILATVGAFALLRVTTENRCVAAGWRDSKVTWTMARYCVAREDQSDVVKPLLYAEQHPR